MRNTYLRGELACVGGGKLVVGCYDGGASFLGLLDEFLYLLGGGGGLALLAQLGDLLEIHSGQIESPVNVAGELPLRAPGKAPEVLFVVRARIGLWT